MLIDPGVGNISPLRQKILDNYRRDELQVIEDLLQMADISHASRVRIWNRARRLVVEIRNTDSVKGGVDALLKEFTLSTEEGVVLMCLAEALLRIPDDLTTDRLIRDKLLSGDWASHLGQSDSLFVNASAWGLLLTGKVISFGDQNVETQQRAQFGMLRQAVTRLGEPVIRASIRYAMQIMGTQFVMGKTIGAAIDRARKQESGGYRFSYDMLGEGARTQRDADRYFSAYMDAIDAIGNAAAGGDPVKNPGISIKLSALHPRYEYAQSRRVMSELVQDVKKLVLSAKAYGIGLTIDAEECNRLDLSLDVIEAVFNDPDLGHWEGFGLAIQAYQKRAIYVIEWVRQLALKNRRRIMVRLVKGAYWDSEIKWAQVDNGGDYPVFTLKSATDVCYLVCAQKLLACRDQIYPQFATHNAYTVATILELTRSDTGRHGYEFQRLHGMGQPLYDQVLKAEDVACRIYAPVGEHADLLAYLVRRLLENGANSSFVNNIVDESVSVEDLLDDPVQNLTQRAVRRSTAIPLPADIYRCSLSAELSRVESSIAKPFVAERRNSKGVDLADRNELIRLQDESQALPGRFGQGPVVISNPADGETVGFVEYADKAEMENKLARAYAAAPAWSRTPYSARADLLRKLADAIETNSALFISLCISEAGKTIPDAFAEVREAVDFCRYYADQAASLYQMGNFRSRGVLLCISPWNFPLAIFLGQVSAALVTGNTVIAKPAEQTSLIANEVVKLIVKLLRQCNFSADAIQIVVSPGSIAGEFFVPDSRIKGVMFTGSTRTGCWLMRKIAARPDADIPLIAETGGQNAMIVDSTALPEQVVDDVIQSGFMSAGQRCSALRVLFLQEEVAPQIIEMLIGAMQELSIGCPDRLSTDIGPLIDSNALTRLQSHQLKLAGLADRSSLLYQCQLSTDCENGHFFAPCLYEIEELSLLQEEVFGPVVHVIRYSANAIDDVVDQINVSGYGLTLGIHSRIESTSRRIAQQVRVGNVYINRNMIGAVVGVQPFGGRGLSGTGPKAGGPHYLPRLVITNDLDAAGQGEAEAIELPHSAEMTQTVMVRKTWISMDIRLRASLIRQNFAEALALADAEIDDVDMGAIDRLIRRAEVLFLAPLDLPGPTGESNLLYLEPRGSIAVVPDADGTSVANLKAIVAALLAGNTVLVPNAGFNSLISSFCDGLNRTGSILDIVTLLPSGTTKSLLTNPDIDGVTLPVGSPYTRSARQALATRTGALIPLIQENDDTRLLVQLSCEKTVTIDTTAAGGNASLMSSGG